MSSTRMRPLEARMAALRGAKSGCGCGHAHGPSHAAHAHEPQSAPSTQNQASAVSATSAASSVPKKEAA